MANLAMPTHVADTVALARYLEGSLPRNADRVFSDAETGNARILLPSIVLGELFYVSLRGRLKVREPLTMILELLDDIESSPHLLPVDMNVDSWRRFLQLRVPELHDRMICAVALAYSADSILTNDPEIAGSGVKTIW